jgi:hypothetical protein
MESKFCSPTQHIAESIVRNGRFRPQKYTAFNLQPTHGQGSAELRVADSTLDTTLMLDYINAGFELRRLGREFNTGWDIIESMLVKDSLSSWIDEHMHPHMAGILVPVARGMDDNVLWQESFATAALMAEEEGTIDKFVI